MTTNGAGVVEVLLDLSRLLQERAGQAPEMEQREEASRLRGHLEELLIPRVLDLNAPLVVVLLGSTGSGKSSLLNGIAGRQISKSGVLRPTTRIAHALVGEGDSLPLALQQLAQEGLVEIHRAGDDWQGMAVVDSPDFDSVEAGNRALARRLLEAADLLVFVTTATRYADEVPWTILDRARRRGVPIVTLINRLPQDPRDRQAVLDDYRRLLSEGDMAEVAAFGPLEITGVEMGELDPSLDGLRREAIGGLLAKLGGLRADAGERRALARKSLEAALERLPAAVEEIAGDIDQESDLAEELMAIAAEAYERRLAEISSQIDRGSFLRAEVLRQWQDFVGANRVARIISEGVGKIAATIRSILDPGPQIAESGVREAAFEDLVALVVAHADEAASATASRWSDRRFGEEAVEENPSLWGSSPGLSDRVESQLEDWAGGVGREIMEMGEGRRGFARAASIGVNALGTSAILAVFASTGGLTGAEAGIAAVTALVNQALLEAIFGEGNVADFVDRARGRLDAIIAAEMDAERQRFADALSVTDHHDRADQLRSLAASAAGERP